MEKLYPDTFWNVSINWTKPKLYENILEKYSEYDDYSYFYKITGQYSTKEHKLYYIGKAYYQTVSMRLSQKDHQKRFNKLSKDYPKHKLYVSFGIVKLANGHITEKRIDQIESLLIYSHDFDHLLNKQKLNELKVTEPYIILNSGYRTPLYKEIHFGIFAK
ncbi:hypothetical protein B6I21_00820 [candidate division KSB1 bacterium 4572_119]|nr:MAG: hypothetical protein B6I21_00820 [candidate division KSB1 bacterium 4572_119]